MHNKKWDLRIICAHAFTILIWGTAFPAIRMGLESYTPEHLTLLRLLIASFILLLFSFIYKLRLPDLKDIPAIFIFGALGFTIYHIALNYGEKNSKCWICKFNNFSHSNSNGNSCFCFFE